MPVTVVRQHNPGNRRLRYRGLPHWRLFYRCPGIGCMRTWWEMRTRNRGPGKGGLVRTCGLRCSCLRWQLQRPEHASIAAERIGRIAAVFRGGDDDVGIGSRPLLPWYLRSKDGFEELARSRIGRKKTIGSPGAIAQLQASQRRTQRIGLYPSRGAVGLGLHHKKTVFGLAGIAYQSQLVGLQSGSRRLGLLWQDRGRRAAAQHEHQQCAQPGACRLAISSPVVLHHISPPAHSGAVLIFLRTGCWCPTHTLPGRRRSCAVCPD